MDEEGIRDLRNYVGGCFVEQDGSEWMDVLEPATGERFARLPLSGSNDVDAAVEAAREAQPGWAALGKDSRADWLDRIADSLEASFEEVAELESRDTGKPISLARAVDANRSVANFRFFAGLIREQEQETFEMEDATNYVVNRPVGVGALITPWNLPLYLLQYSLHYRLLH